MQAELRAKTGSPNLGPTHMPQNLVQPPPIHRAIMNRHQQSRRSTTTSIAPKTEPTSLPTPHRGTASPKSRPTPPSHGSSPKNNAAGFSPAASDNFTVRGGAPAMPRPPVHSLPATTQQQRQAPPQSGSGGRGQGASGAAFYPTPAFQNHIEQLGKSHNVVQNNLSSGG